MILPTGSLPSHSGGLDLDFRAHRLQRANEADARLVDADVLDHEPPGKGARNDAGDRQRSGRNVAGKGKVERRQPVRRSHANGRLRLIDRDPEMTQQTLGMIPRLGAASDDRFTAALQSGKEQSRHRLRAEDVDLMVDGAKLRSANDAPATGLATTS